VTVPFEGTATIVVRARPSTLSELRVLASIEYDKLTTEQQNACCDSWSFVGVYADAAEMTAEVPLSEQPPKPLTEKRAWRKVSRLVGEAMLADGPYASPWVFHADYNEAFVQNFITRLRTYDRRGARMATKLQAALDVWRNAV
jgi:hypothetical protein